LDFGDPRRQRLAGLGPDFDPQRALAWVGGVVGPAIYRRHMEDGLPTQGFRHRGEPGVERGQAADHGRHVRDGVDALLGRRPVRRAAMNDDVQPPETLVLHDYFAYPLGLEDDGSVIAVALHEIECPDRSTLFVDREDGDDVAAGTFA